MAKKTKKKGKRKREEKRVTLRFTAKNYTGLAIGIVCILVGFLTLSKGSITLAPILLVLGYCVIVPVAILLK